MPLTTRDRHGGWAFRRRRPSGKIGYHEILCSAGRQGKAEWPGGAAKSGGGRVRVPKGQEIQARKGSRAAHECQHFHGLQPPPPRRKAIFRAPFIAMHGIRTMGHSRSPFSLFKPFLINGLRRLIPPSAPAAGPAENDHPPPAQLARPAPAKCTARRRVAVLTQAADNDLGPAGGTVLPKLADQLPRVAGPGGGHPCTCDAG
jgi:hypothetical protein